MIVRITKLISVVAVVILLSTLFFSSISPIFKVGTPATTQFLLSGVLEAIFLILIMAAYYGLILLTTLIIFIITFSINYIKDNKRARFNDIFCSVDQFLPNLFNAFWGIGDSK